MTKLKEKVLLLSFLVISSFSFGQIQMQNYTFTTDTNGSLDNMSNSTILFTNSDNDYSSTLPIGFDFVYDGLVYQIFSVSTNGIIRLGDVAISNTPDNLITNATSNKPAIYPYFDDLHTGIDGKVHYKITGSSPNRILKIEWHVALPKSTTNNANSKIQCWLHEGSNKVEFVYNIANTQNSNYFSVGMANTLTNMSNVITSNNTLSTFYNLNNNMANPTANRRFTFSAANCFSPINVVRNSLEYNQVSYSWDASLDAWAYRWELTNSLNPSLNKSGNSFDTNIVIDELTQGTYYTFKVRSSCDNDATSAYSNASSFTTPIVCSTIQQVRTTGLDDSQVWLEWDADTSSENIQYEIEYGAEGFTRGTGTTLISDTNNVHVTNLTTDLTYDFYVRKICNFYGINSNWSTVHKVKPTQSISNPIGIWSIYKQWQSFGPEAEAPCAHEITIHVPPGKRIKKLTAKYRMQTDNIYQIYSQRSIIKSTTLNERESSLAQGTNVHANYLDYEREISFAKWKSGSIKFQLHLFNSHTGNCEANKGFWVNPNDWQMIVEYDDIPTCWETTNTSIASSYHSAVVTSDFNGDHYEVQYGLEGFQLGTGTTIAGAINSNTITLNDLTHNSNHQYYTRSVCAEDDKSPWSGPYQFRTEVEPDTVPMLEEFYTTNSPLNWLRSIDFKIGTYHNVTNGDGNYMYQYVASYARTGHFTTNQIGPILEDSNLSFQYFYKHITEYATVGTINIEISTNNGQTYTNLKTINTSAESGWYTENIDLSNYVGQIIKLKFNVSTTTGTDAQVYVVAFDKISVATPTSCVQPTNLSTSNIEDVKATLNWTGNANQYEVQYGLTNFTLGSGTIKSAETNSITIMGLTQNAAHQFYVRSICGNENSDWAGPYNFTTERSPVAIPWYEPFNQSTMPDGWTNISSSIQPDTVNGGYYLSITCSYLESMPEQYPNGAVTPLLGRVKMGNSLSFRYSASTQAFWNSSFSGAAQFTISISVDDGLTFSTLRQYTINSNVANTNVNIDLTPYHGKNIKLKFESTMLYGLNLNAVHINVDELRIQGVPTWTEENNWDNLIGPNSNQDALIEGEFTANENFEVKNLYISQNAQLTVPNNQKLTVNGYILNAGAGENMVLESGANLIQSNSNAVNQGEITVIRNSDEMVRLDYTMWSSPVSGQNILAFSPHTVPTRIFTYEGSQGYVSVTNPAENLMQKGKGYLFRAPNNWWENEAPLPSQPFIGNFVGNPNNGSITQNIYAGSYSSVGNPYPSNIDADLFLAANAGISSLYFWTNTNQADGNGGYVANNYATYTTMGGVAPANGFEVPNGVIAVGQGFITNSTHANMVTFNNSMRTDNSALFFKNENNQKNRFWINLSKEENISLNQNLIGYMNGATNEVDAQIDGKEFINEGSALYSVLNEENYVIQGRALPFESSDIVQLGFRATESGNFEISLGTLEGIFEEEVSIFIKDKMLNLIHPLNQSNYSFESQEGIFNNRFEIIYETESEMNVNDLNPSEITIYTKDQQIFVNSKDEKIIAVELFDLEGKSLHNQTKINQNTYDFHTIAKGVLIVKTQTSKGKIITKKIMVN